MDPTQFMQHMPTMVAPHLLPGFTPTSVAAPAVPFDVLGLWANGKSTYCCAKDSREINLCSLSSLLLSGLFQNFAALQRILFYFTSMFE